MPLVNDVVGGVELFKWRAAKELPRKYAAQHDGPIGNLLSSASIGRAKPAA